MKARHLRKDWKVWANAGNASRLVNYAQKLLLDAENYAVTDLEKHLGEFAALVEQLDQSTDP